MKKSLNTPKTPEMFNIDNTTKVFTFLTIFLITVCFFQSCNKSSEKSESKVKITRSEDLNPNGDSELAILMREMLAHAKHTQQLIKDGLTTPPTLPQSQYNLRTAKATKPEKRGDGFDEMAEIYLAYLEELHTPNGLRIYNHNNLINSCINCHQSFCTGPIPTIQKLMINND